MGIGIVLLAWTVIGLILASVAALTLGVLAAYFTRGARRERRRVILAAALFPFLSMGWVCAVFVFQAVINEAFLHRDPGLGDTWKCPLPDGYAILMIDSPDEGFIYNPGTQPIESVGEQDDAIAGVRVLQIAGPYILGGMDTKWGSDKVDSYFVLDTRSGTHVALPTYDALRKSAQDAGVALKLEEIGTVYRRYRFTWFEVLAGILFAGPPILAFVFLARWVSRVRRTRETAFEPST